MIIEAEQTIVFIGDSITDCDRRSMHPPLGDGYVSMFATKLKYQHNDLGVKIINRGISGDTVTGMRDRWDQDVTQYEPDWLSVKIGINDLHSTLMPDWGISVTPDLYREAYDDILTATKTKLPNCKILLIDPFYISKETNPDNFETKVLGLIKEYIDIVDDMASKYDTLHIKTHAIFQDLLKTHNPSEYCPEPVHPYESGHQVIADAVYDILS